MKPGGKFLEPSTRELGKPYDFLAWDTEGNAREFLGASFAWRDRDGRECSTFEEDKEESQRLFYELGEGRIAVAHNAMYDLGVLFDQPWEDVELTVVRGRMLSGSVGLPPKRAAGYLPGFEPTKRADRRIQVWDSFGLAPMALEAIGKSIGLVKLTTPPSLAPLEAGKEPWTCERHGLEWCIGCYATRDAEIVLRYMELIQEQIRADGVRLKNRIAGNALATWVQISGADVIPVLANHWSEGGESFRISRPVEEVLPHVRTGYRAGFAGGRTEVFNTDEHERVTVWDVNSMYPYVMHEMAYPDPRSRVIEGPDEWCPELPGMTACRVHVPASKDGRLPILQVKVGGELYWPTGDFTGVWTNAELVEAERAGATVREVFWSHSYRRSMRPFQAYVELWHGRKQAARVSGDDGAAFVAKTMLNSLYGKLALNSENGGLTRVVPLGHFNYPERCNDCRGCREHAVCRRQESIRQWGKYWELPVITGPPPPYVNVLWAAHVTAYARLHLWRLMNPFREWLLYCDTDSLHLKEDAPKMWEDGGALGQLKLEAVHVVGQYKSPKEYRWKETPDSEWEYKSKGIPQISRRGAEVINPRAEYWERGSTSYETALTLRTGGPKDAVSTWETIRKERERTIPKRDLGAAWSYSDLIRLHQLEETRRMNL